MPGVKHLPAALARGRFLCPAGRVRTPVNGIEIHVHSKPLEDIRRDLALCFGNLQILRYEAGDGLIGITAFGKKPLRRIETPAGPVILAIVGANEIVGEMGILCNAPRNATVCAKDRLIALRISKELFMRMVREFPTIAVSIMQELAHRLESTNNQLRTAHAEVKRLRETAGIAA